MINDEFALPRQRMVERLRDHYQIRDEKVLGAMNHAPRHLFVPEALRSQSYGDHALPIVAGQTISQPFIVAKMTELLELNSRSRVLEIGAGSGYQSTILALLAKEVFAVERIQALADEASARFRQLKIRNVFLRVADGTRGWEAGAPFDAILVAAGGNEIPQPLMEQLTVGGRLIIPVGDRREAQTLIRVTRRENGFVEENCGACAFVPLIGQHGWT